MSNLTKLQETWFNLPKKKVFSFTAILKSSDVHQVDLASKHQISAYAQKAQG